LKQQCGGAGETSITTNYELQGTGRATRAPVTQTLQSGKSEPEPEVHISPIQATPIKQDPEAELILHKAKKVHVKSEPEAEF
jgi:hypothetical protein